MKRMMEIDTRFDEPVYKINSSSADLIHTCRKKAFYALKVGARPDTESSALLFGSALHKALEAFYITPPECRSLQFVTDTFVDYASATKLAELPSDDKRSIKNGQKIIEKYFQVYASDPWVTVVDKRGPVVERSFEFKADNYDGLYLHGQIDALMQNTETGEVVVVDHKTSSSLGSDFMNRIKPNLQFSTYAWAANKMGFNVGRVMVNGIQVAKTKTDLVRVFTERTKEDFREMEETFFEARRLYHYSDTYNTWPLNSLACSHWGGCPYREVCALPEAQRKNALEVLAGKALESE